VPSFPPLNSKGPSLNLHKMHPCRKASSRSTVSSFRASGAKGIAYIALVSGRKALAGHLEGLTAGISPRKRSDVATFKKKKMLYETICPKTFCSTLIISSWVANGGHLPTYRQLNALVSTQSDSCAEGRGRYVMQSVREISTVKIIVIVIGL